LTNKPRKDPNGSFLKFSQWNAAGRRSIDKIDSKYQYINGTPPGGVPLRRSKNINKRLMERRPAAFHWINAEIWQKEQYRL